VNEDATAIPHRMKNINAKYSARFTPTFSISRELRKKYSKVLPNAIELKSNPKLSNDNIPLVLNLKKLYPNCSATFANNNTERHRIAIALMVFLCEVNTPQNIITTPKIADNTIAFIITE
jgi:hypothetical protein